MTDHAEDRRKRSRVHGSYPLVLMLENRAVEVVTRDLSLKGVLAELPPDVAPPPVETTCLVRIPLSAELEVAAQAVVVRVDDSEIALDFTGIEPESYPHLREMVRLNAPDPDRIDEEQYAEPFAPERLNTTTATSASAEPPGQMAEQGSGAPAGRSAAESGLGDPMDDAFEPVDAKARPTRDVNAASSPEDHGDTPSPTTEPQGPLQ